MRHGREWVRRESASRSRPAPLATRRDDTRPGTRRALATAMTAAMLASTAACSTSQGNAILRSQVKADRFHSVLRDGRPTEESVRSLIARTDGATFIARADNPWRGGTSAALKFTSTARAGLNQPATEATCVRLDLTGRAFTAEDWHEMGSCPTEPSRDALPPELPDGSDRRVSNRLAVAKGRPQERQVVEALRAALPRGVDVVAGRFAEYQGPDGAAWGYRGGAVVTAVATAGAGCLVVWVWRGGSVVWRPQEWAACGVTPSELVVPGALPVDGRDNPVVRPSAVGHVAPSSTS